MQTTLHGAWDAKASRVSQQMSQPQSTAALPPQSGAVQSSACSKKSQVCVKYRARGLRMFRQLILLQAGELVSARKGARSPL